MPDRKFPNPAFIVEGRMEQDIIRKMCPGVPVVLINCNGDNVPASTMGRFIDVQARTLKHYRPKIIVCDREGRDVGAEEFANLILKDLEERRSPGSFIIGVADREFENWILAGIPNDYKCEYFEMRSEFVQEGCYGKSMVYKGMRGVRYQPRHHGANLFAVCRATLLRERSPSARGFLNQIQGLCHWTISK